MIVSLRQQLVEKQQRGMLRVTGSEEEVTASCERCIAELTSVWPDLKILRFGHESNSKSVSKQNDQRIKKYRSLLGQECDLLVFNVYAGLNPDALAALAGTIKVGGMCLLLTPNDTDWLKFSDPEKAKLCVAPYQADDLSGWYEKRLVSLLNDSVACLHLHHNEYSSDFSALVTNKAQANTAFQFSTKTKEQQAAVEGVIQVLSGENHVALVVSDRGRGKSTSLGLAIAEFFSVAQNPISLALVSPYSDSVQTVFQHLTQSLAEKGVQFEQQKNQVILDGHRLQFLPPDQIESQLEQIDVFLIDEAAAVPVFLLEPIINSQKRMVLATTISGYEGTGRGFEYKLKPKLKERYPGYSQFELSEPIRWRREDALEPLINKLLALDIQVAESSIPEYVPKQPKLRKVDKEELSKQPRLLDNIFSLLINAHYQTKPSDLRTLLDGPNMSVWVIEESEMIVAALLVAEEGPIDPELVAPIWRGERRPRGHLFPQSLIFHSGYLAGGQFRYARVVRIAVHPQLQNQGIGSSALNTLISIYQTQGFDFVCTSFGASAKLISFWQKAGLKPVRIGLKKEKATGEVSALMALGLTQAAETLRQKWTERFEQILACELRLGLREQFDLIGTTQLNLSSDLDEQDRHDLDNYVNFHKPLDTVWLAIWRYVNSTSKEDVTTLKLLLDNANDLRLVVDILGVSGEKQLNQKLKQALKTSLQSAQ